MSNIVATIRSSKVVRAFLAMAMMLGLLGPLAPAAVPALAANDRPTTLTVTPASGTYGGTTTLQATLTWTNPGGQNGGPVVGATVSFRLNGNSFGSNSAVTDSNGVAKLSSVSLSGINAGTYNGGAGASFAAGTVGNQSYLGSTGSATLTVARAQATITLSSLSQVYDGTAKAATATTNPAGLTGVSITYSQNGQSVLSPTNAGAYDVVASLNNLNYQATNATGQLIIAKANQTITFGSLADKTYGAADFAVSATGGASGNPVTFAATGQCAVSGSTVHITGAGTCTITASQAGNSNYNAATSVPQTFNVFKATATVTLSNLNQTYDGTAHSARDTTSPSGLSVGLTYDGSATAPTNAGSYAVVATVNDANYEGSANGTLVIAPANATITLGNLSQDYNGTARTASASTTPPGLSVSITYNGSAQAPTNAGSYTVVATITDPNYQGSATDTLVINKANQTISFADLPDKTFGAADFGVNATGGASGNPVTFAATGQCAVSGSTVHITGAGTCTITASQAGNSNYNAAPDVPQKFNIFKAQATITLGNLSQVYNGSANAVTASTSPAGLNVSISYAGAPDVPVDAGSYAVLATIDDANYQGSQTGTLVIAPASQTITFAQLGNKTYGDQDFEVTASASSGLPVSFAASGACSVTGSIVRITGAGGCIITASQAGNNNYQPADNAQQAFSIGKATATISLSNLGFTYDGTAHAAAATTSPDGLAVQITYSQNGQPVTAPTNAGSYAVAATVSDDNYQGSTTDTLTIAKADQTINFGALGNRTYGDPSFTLSAAASSGLPVSFAGGGNCVVSGTTVQITGAGGCTVTASQAGNGNYNPAPPIPQSFAIARATANVVLGGLTNTYDGSPHGATVSTTPGGLNVTLLYNGSPQAPTNAGSYAVFATVQDPNYQGGTGGTLVIAPAGATIMLGNLSTTYDGSPKVASANTNPPNLPVAITYDGSSVPPVNAGSYAVSASITNSNYQGTAQGTLVVAQASQTISFGSLGSKTFGDAPFEVSAAGGASGNPVTFTAQGNCTASGANVTITGAGSCTVTANQAGNNNYLAAPGVAQTFSIAKAQAAVSLTNLVFAYNGAAHAASASTDPSGLTVDITYDGSTTAPTNAGSYVVVATVNSANYQGSASDTLVINKASQTISFSPLADKTYGDPDFAVSATADSGLPVSFTASGNCTISGATVHIAGAGSCAVSTSQAGNGNFEAAAGVEQNFKIAKGSVNVLLSNLSYTYDGAAHGVTATTDPVAGLHVDISYDGSATVPTNAGSYPVVATINDTNYQGSAQDTLVIAPAGAHITLDDLSHTYDGTIKTASANTNPAGLGVSFSYSQDGQPVTNPIDAGSYDVVASITDPNYRGSVQDKLVIAPASQAITFGGLADKTYGDADFAVSATGGASGNPVTFTAQGNCTASGANVTITGAGSCTVTANQAGSNNYLAAPSVPQTFSIAKKTIDVTLTGLSNTYDGSPHAAAASTDPSGLTVDITYDGSTTAPTNAGSYVVVATVNSANYQGSASDTLVINKASQTISFSPLADKTYGDPAFPATATASSGLPVSFTASGNCTSSDAIITITGAGSCAVTATQGGNNNFEAASAVSQNFSVAKAHATVELSNLSYTYDGSAHGAAANTTPAGLSVDVTYGGFSTAPTNAGNYPVVATINDANYQGSAQGTLVIAQAGADITLDNLEQTYNGSPRLASANTDPADLGVSISYSQNGQPVTNPTNAGSYMVVASITNPNYQGNAEGELVIAPASQTIIFASVSNKTYGDADFPVSATGGASGNPVTFTAQGNCTVSGANVHITGAGSCTLWANQAGNNNYLAAAQAKQSFDIAKGHATVSLGTLSYTYDGTAHGTTAGTTPAGLTVVITYDGSTTAPTNAGSYAVVASVNDINYEGKANDTLVIAKASQTITFGALPNRTYGDPDFTVSAAGGASGNPVAFSAAGGCSVNGTTVHLVSAGSCTITAEQADSDNYLPAPSVSRSFNIAAWRFDGFYSPTNMTPTGANTLTYNTINGGQTVPLKFNVYQGNTRLTSTSAVQQPLKVYQFSCAAGPTSQVTMTATGGTSLRYDSTSNQFVYNWQTPATQACFKVTITTADGSVSPPAYFKTR